MIPYPYNMVDMGGIDLAEANGTVVEGLYAKIVEAVNACGDVVLYNWKFAGIEIAPQHTSILLGDPITINGAVQVTEQDLVTVPGINPEPPPPPTLVPLSVTENGQYSPADYDADGFSLVEVGVPPPSLEVLTVTQDNTEYFPSEGHVGFSKVIVAIEGAPPIVTVAVNGGYNGGAVVTVSKGNVTIFSATADSPYNLVYTPNSASPLVNGSPLIISIPNLSNNQSQLVINMSWSNEEKSVTFNHSGQNTSYGYGSQSTIVDFGQ